MLRKQISVTKPKMTTAKQKCANFDVCEFCQSNKIHPMFCYLIVSDQTEHNDNITQRYACEALSNKKNISDKTTQSNSPLHYIGISRLPYHRLESHNRNPGFKLGSKLTKDNAGSWRMKLFVGPWYGSGANQFKRNWKQSNRTLNSRIQYAYEESKRLNKIVFLDN